MTSEPSNLAGGLLTVNTGSSSLKLAVYANEQGLPRRLGIVVERIGLSNGRLSCTSSAGVTNEEIPTSDHSAALQVALEYVNKRLAFTPSGVGHRIVHGGPTHARSQRISPDLMSELRSLQEIDPGHMPQALAAVDSMAVRYPTVPQVVCFDTAFHRSMGPIAQRYPLPRWTADAGIRRYGFHGLSCEFIVSALARIDPRAADGRLLIAHLGNGSSITAVHRGASVDTTMGFSPCGGVMMGTRSGDLDPTIVTYLARTRKCTAEDLQRLLNEESGLLGVSEVSQDMRDVLGHAGSPRAAEAIELYCYTARKHVGALAAVLDGVDTIVFTGGIGEHAAPIREGICRGLGHLGVAIDPKRNAADEDVISTPGNRVTVRVMATDEDAVIAGHVRRLLDDDLGDNRGWSGR
jgi:acetate kinase